MTKFGEGREYFPPLAPETRALLDHVHDKEGAREVEINVTSCPGCGTVTNYLVGEAGDGVVVPDAPKPGQPALCSTCGAFLYFDRGLQLRELVVACGDASARRLSRGGGADLRDRAFQAGPGEGGLIVLVSVIHRRRG